MKQAALDSDGHVRSKAAGARLELHPPFGAIGIAGLGLAVLLALAGCHKRPPGQTEAQADFVQTCARCHGAEGTGGPPQSAGAPRPRNFHDASFQASRTDDDLRKTIREGKAPHMPAFAGQFSDEQVRGLVGVVRSFDPSAKDGGALAATPPR